MIQLKISPEKLQFRGNSANHSKPFPEIVGNQVALSRIFAPSCSRLSDLHTSPQSAGACIQRVVELPAQILALVRNNTEKLVEVYYAAMRMTASYSADRWIDKLFTEKRKSDRSIRKNSITAEEAASFFKEQAAVLIDNDAVAFISGLNEEVMQTMLDLLLGNTVEARVEDVEYTPPEPEDLFPETFGYDEAHFRASDHYSPNFFQHHFANTYEEAKSKSESRATDRNTVLAAGQLETFYLNEMPRDPGPIYESRKTYVYWFFDKKEELDTRMIYSAKIKFGVANIRGLRVVNHLDNTSDAVQVSHEPAGAYLKWMPDLITAARELNDVLSDVPEAKTLVRLLSFISFNLDKLKSLFDSRSPALDLHLALTVICGAVDAYCEILEPVMQEEAVHENEEALEYYDLLIDMQNQVSPIFNGLLQTRNWNDLTFHICPELSAE